MTAYSEGFTRIYMYAGGKVGSCDVTVYADLPGLVLPQKLTELEEEAFMGKNSFRYALLPDGLTTIGNRAFANNERLLFVYIPDTVDSFGGPDIFPEGVLPFSTKATMMQRIIASNTELIRSTCPDPLF